jgi:Fe-S-cluster containining protein
MKTVPCKKCGKCCTNLILEVSSYDRKMPRDLKKKCRPFKDCYGFSMNSDNPPYACIFLSGRKCGIYEDRPQLCRNFKPGKQNEQCFGYAKEKLT